MPRYDYRCAGCGHIFEARHGYHDAAPACPTCGAPEPRKVIQAVGIIVKGPAASCAREMNCPYPDTCGAGGCLGSQFSRN